MFREYGRAIDQKAKTHVLVSSAQHGPECTGKERSFDQALLLVGYKGL